MDFEDATAYHEGVEATQLRDRHESTSRNQRPEVRGNDIELLEHPPLTFARGDLLGRLNMDSDVLHLLADLLFGAIGEDLANDVLSLLVLAMVDQLAWRF